MHAYLETRDGDMEALRLSTSLDQGMRLRRPESGRDLFPWAQTQEEWLVALPARFRTPTPLSQGCHGNSREAPERLGTPEGQFLGERPGLSQLWQGGLWRMSSLQNHGASLSQACSLFLCSSVTGTFLLRWPPAFVEDWPLVLGTLTLFWGYWAASFTYKKPSGLLGISQLVSSKDRISERALTWSLLFIAVWNPDQSYSIH